MKTKRTDIRTASILVVGLMLATLAVSCRNRTEESLADTRQWRKVLAFDVTDTSETHDSEVGNGTVVVARFERPIGWDIGVYSNRLSEQAENMLFEGESAHGPQPWHSFAWTKRKQLYPDTRLIEYGDPVQILKIVLTDCHTVKTNKVVVFSRGRIEVYHHP